MKITDVEAIILRQPALDDGIADGSQDDLVIKVHTDEGIVGIGEVDSSPLVASSVKAPSTSLVVLVRVFEPRRPTPSFSVSVNL